MQAYDQISTEISNFIVEKYGLKQGDDFEVAVVGLKIDSEHEDSCFATIELNESSLGERMILATRALESLCNDASEKLSKGSRPDYVLFGNLPRTFKGTVETKKLKEAAKVWAVEKGLNIME